MAFLGTSLPNKMDVVTTFLVNTEGERFQRLLDTEGVTRDMVWYAEKAVELIKSCPGGPTNCAHLCVDAGTPGVHGQEEKLQSLIQVELPWVTVTLPRDPPSWAPRKLIFRGC